MSESKYQFERLTPNNNVELGIYEDAINYVFENPDIKNVAISGPYSSGKSSILESYKNVHKDRKFLHISLAHFNFHNQETENNIEKANLEGKIINQLIHQLQTKNIPQTDFKLKINFSLKNIIVSTAMVCLLLFAIFYFIFFDSWCEYVLLLPDDKKEALLFSTHSMMQLLSGIIIITLLCFYIYKLVAIQKNKNIFRKLSVQGNEIEIFEDDNASYFDKYLNEVLYLLENTKADVIVFEDMDRYDIGIIFERLREINILVNVRRQQNKKQFDIINTLRFFYLIRDDIFISKDRTKFFDYIIPVIPVMDSSNSYEQIISHLQKSDLENKFNNKFLRGISLYIDDMRILKNIYNEFLIYYNKLSKIELDYNKMFAIITYKNLFPRDFNDLQLNKGFVYTIFSKKSSFIQLEKTRVQQKIEENRQKIELINNEHLKSIHELNIVYAYNYLGGSYWYNYSDEEIKEELKQYLAEDYRNEYNKRADFIENIANSRIGFLNEEINNLESKILEIENKKLYQIVGQNNSDEIFGINDSEFYEIKGNEYFDLLKYLIQNGYIDENYSDYMTYFYENTLSLSDKIFIRSVLDRRNSKDYNYHLDNPELIITYFELVNFDQKEILNMDLFIYLLRKPSYKEYLKRFVQTIKEYKAVDFIKEFLEKNLEISFGVKCLNEIWPKMFSFACLHGGLTDAQIYQYSLLTIYHNEYNVIGNVNENNILRDYISNHCNYLAISEFEIERLVDVFRWLNVKFVKLNYDTANKDLFQAIYDNSLYEINFNNISLMLDVYFDEHFIYEIKHKNYTKILSQPNSPLAEYINNNFDVYLNIILKESNNEINDDENVVIELLNNADISDESKEIYINSLQTNIKAIKLINNKEFWKQLAKHKKVFCSEINIIEYFIAFNSLDENIIECINTIKNKLDFSDIKKMYDEEYVGDFYDAVVQCNEMINVQYKQILLSLDYQYNVFDFLNISKGKIYILINLNIIRMNEENLEFMRENYKEQVLYFILKNIEKYVEIIKVDLFSFGELLEILDSNVDDELKIKLLDFTNAGISIINKKYSLVICKYILQNNLEKSDLNQLFLSFENWDREIQEIIFDFAIENIEMIMENCINVSNKLKNRLLLSNKVSEHNKTELLIAMLSNLSSEATKEMFSKLGMSEFVNIFNKRTRPKIKINDKNKNILVALKEKSFIKNFEKDTNRSGYYRIKRS